MNSENIADQISDESVIEFTQKMVLTPDEAFTLNQIIYRKTLEALSGKTAKDLEGALA